MTSDIEYMRRALKLAEKGKGTTSPNPMVGCVIVKDGKIIGEGYHKKAGEDHAEIAALKNCKESCQGATMYVTLEPCNTYGRTLPCVDRLLKERLKEVVIAVKDPNPGTCGKSIEKLKKAGVTVKVGILEEDAAELNRHFFKWITKGLPYVYLKAAITLDGKIATRKYDSKWISSEAARRWVHHKRREVDAILVGATTVIKDNPQLTSRLADTKYPIRIIVDTHGRLTGTLNVFSGEGKIIILTANRMHQVPKAKMIVCDTSSGLIDLKDALKRLAGENITSIMVEGGGKVFSNFIRERLVDEFIFFIAPKLLGDKEALSVFEDGTKETIKEAKQLKFTDIQKIGDDILAHAVWKD